MRIDETNKCECCHADNKVIYYCDSGNGATSNYVWLCEPCRKKHHYFKKSNCLKKNQIKL